MNSDEGRDFVPAPDAENKQWMWAHPGGIIYSTPLKAQGMLQERGWEVYKGMSHEKARRQAKELHLNTMF